MKRHRPCLGGPMRTYKTQYPIQMALTLALGFTCLCRSGLCSPVDPASLAAPFLQGIPIAEAAAGPGSNPIERGRGDEGQSPSETQVGLRVHPPVMHVSMVPPGTDFRLRAPITIENTGSRPVRCRIEPIQPSTIGIRYMRGYTDIPDPSWCRPSVGDLYLEPHEAISVPVTMTVPSGPCQTNRSWCVAFSIQTVGAASLGAAAYPYAYVETTIEENSPRPPNTATGDRAQSAESGRGAGTESVAGAGGRRYGDGDGGRRPGACLHVTPGYLDAGDVSAGETASAGSISILNGYDQEIVVEIKAVVPPELGLARGVLVTPGHIWVESTRMIQPEMLRLSLAAGETAELEVAVAAPEDPSKYNYRWEGYLECDGPWGPEALVRVRWRTVSPTRPDSASAGY